MKIALNMGNNGNQSSKAAQAKVLERDIMAAKKGDWNAKNNLVRTFMPLLTSLAEKRSKDLPSINNYIEAGKEGVFKAAKKYNPSVGAERFHIFAVEFIEKSMDKRDKGGGFWARLFGG
jgi:DNA-directed RNA polymerase specialized sigma subunit